MENGFQWGTKSTPVCLDCCPESTLAVIPRRCRVHYVAIPTILLGEPSQHQVHSDHEHCLLLHVPRSLQVNLVLKVCGMQALHWMFYVWELLQCLRLAKLMYLEIEANLSTEKNMNFIFSPCRQSWLTCTLYTFDHSISIRWLCRWNANIPSTLELLYVLPIQCVWPPRRFYQRGAEVYFWKEAIWFVAWFLHDWLARKNIWVTKHEALLCAHS